MWQRGNSSYHIPYHSVRLATSVFVSNRINYSTTDSFTPLCKLHFVVWLYSFRQFLIQWARPRTWAAAISYILNISKFDQGGELLSLTLDHGASLGLPIHNFKTSLMFYPSKHGDFKTTTFEICIKLISCVFRDHRGEEDKFLLHSRVKQD